jgi:hypothetical protein
MDPLDYSTFVIWRVLHEAKWGEQVTSDPKKRYELVVDFFNTILADNSALAVNSQCPCGFDQVPHHSRVLKLVFHSKDPINHRSSIGTNINNKQFAQVAI